MLELSLDAALVAGIALATAAPIAVRILQRRFDFFEPLTTIAICLVVMYVLRPAAFLSQGKDQVFKGYLLGPHVTEALTVILCGVVALQLGYAMPWPRRVAARLPRARDSWNAQTTIAFALALSIGATLLFSVFLIQAGGLHVLMSFLAGRSSSQLGYFDDSSAYFWAAPTLFWPASLLVFALGVAQRRRDFVILAVALMAPLAIFAGGQGNRLVLLPLLLAPPIYWMLARGRRPRLPVLLVGGYLFFTIGIAYFRETRVTSDNVSRIAQIEQSLRDPGYEYRELVFHGVDNDMFDSLAAELAVIPELLEPAPLDFIYRTVAKPIPRMLWPGKPLQPEQQLTEIMYPNEITRASSSSGLVGNLYHFGGLAGVIGGMFLIGGLFRVPWEYFRRFRSSGTAQIFITSFLMFIPILLRGAIGETLALALFGLGPLVLAARLCQKKAS